MSIDGPNSPAGPSLERRMHPRTDAISSLNRILESARLRHGISTLVLADDCGLLIAGSGHFARCEELAARAAIGHTTSARPIRIEGADLLLAYEGADWAGVDFVRSACQRVLGRKRPALATA